MPAPHDQRFVKMFRFAQKKEIWTDGELLASFERCLTHAIERTPGVGADMAILKALRAWFRYLFPGKDIHAMLSYDRELEYRPGYGNAVVCPRGQPGTFYWDTRTHVTTWAWWDPEKERELLAYDPSLQGQGVSGERPGGGSGRSDRRPEGQGPRTSQGDRRFTAQVSRVAPGPISASTRFRQSSHQTNTPSIDEDEEMADNGNMASNDVKMEDNEENAAPRVAYVDAAHDDTITTGPYQSRVVAENPNEYLALESFITLKGLKAGFHKDDLELGWRRSTEQCWEHFGDHGQAYVQYRAEMNYWNVMFPDEVFPGRDPLTRKFHMYTANEMADNHALCPNYRAPDASESTSSSAEPAAKRARLSNEEDAEEEAEADK
ncbi:hypothetical protein VTL71DRAFT_2113 [Oculimacula yallundae]|uniref:Uncharacterized protein n=1 Tax=Oculimacula yallundae TaxID=86028 RepID=A0ABR4C8P0_9HELO